MRELSQIELAGLFGAAPDAMVAVDVMGDVLLFNAAAEELFGYSRDEVIGQSVDTLLPEGLRDRHPAYREAYLSDPQRRPAGVALALAGMKKDGSEFAAEILLSPLGDGEDAIIMAAVREQTAERLDAQRDRERLRAQLDRDQLEIQLQQARRLESLGLFAGGIAHDLNNELAIIINYTRFAERAIAALRSSFPVESIQQDLDEVTESGVRAAVLVRQLLAFGRREVVQPVVLDLNVVVEEVEQLLRRTIGAEFTLSVSRAVALGLVLIDPSEIRQVLLNLALNARQAMPSGGTLTITTENIITGEATVGQFPDAVAGAAYIRLQVGDSGTGMQPEVEARALEPFFTTKAEGEGTGLGLSNAHGIVTQARGNLHIETAPGAGTTISILLPITAEPVPRADPAATHDPVDGIETVLVVESALRVRETARRILLGSGYQVLIAGSGAEAISVAGSHSGTIHLLLTDLVMPAMGGQELGERLFLTRPDMRVLYMSGYAGTIMTPPGALNAGVELLVKPFTEATLLTRVRDLLDVPPQAEPELVAQGLALAERSVSE